MTIFVIWYRDFWVTTTCFFKWSPLILDITKQLKANLRDFIAATGLVILLKFYPNHRFFSQCELEMGWMTSKNNRAPLLYYIKLCASFQIHRWIQTEVTVRKRSIRVKIGDILSRATLKFDGWPWKTIGHLFYSTSSFVHHFEAMGETGVTVPKRSIRVKIGNFFLSSVTLKFEGWPWKSIGHLIYVASSFVSHFIAISEFKLESQAGNAHFRSKSSIFLAVWPWNLTDDLDKNNRAPLLFFFKLCASCHSHWWIQTGATVRKPPIWVTCVTLKFDGWPWKTIGHLFLHFLPLDSKDEWRGINFFLQMRELLVACH